MGTTAKTDRSTAELDRDRQNMRSQNDQSQQFKQPRDGRAESANYIEHPARSGTMDRSNGDKQRREEQPVGSSAPS